jgi:phosphate transport system permease protein
MARVDVRPDTGAGPAGLPGEGPAALEAPPAATTLPQRTARRHPPRRRELTTLRLADVVSIVGAFFAAGFTTLLLWTEVSPFSGVIGFVVVWWILFGIYYAVLIAFDEDRMAVRDRLSTFVMLSFAIFIIFMLCWVIGYTFLRGWPALIHVNFYTQDGRFGGPLTPLTKSGALEAVVGTLIEIGIAMSFAIPFGVLTAVFINEVPGRYATMIRTVVDAMTAMPDILAGLFIYATLISALGFPLSGLCAGIALGITALPIITRASDVVLRLMPGGLTEASYALGAGQWRTVRLVTLPTVRSGLATAVILGVARAIGETAPVLLTSVASEYLTTNPGIAMNSLPLLAYSSVQEPQAVEFARAFGAAALLLILVVILFSIARWIGGRGPGQLSAGQQRRRAAASRRDAARYLRLERAALAVPESQELR